MPPKKTTPKGTTKSESIQRTYSPNRKDVTVKKKVTYTLPQETKPVKPVKKESKITFIETKPKKKK